jgi:hypothetical protein
MYVGGATIEDEQGNPADASLKLNTYQNKSAKFVINDENQKSECKFVSEFDKIKAVAQRNMSCNIQIGDKSKKGTSIQSAVERFNQDNS